MNSFNNRNTWEVCARFQQQLSASSLSRTVSLEERLENYQEWLRLNPNAKQEHKLWHKGQVIKIKTAIKERDA